MRGLGSGRRKASPTSQPSHLPICIKKKGEGTSRVGGGKLGYAEISGKLL